MIHAQCHTIIVMSAIATGGTITLLDENEGKNVQNEGVSLHLVDRTETVIWTLSRLKNLANNHCELVGTPCSK